MKKKIFYAIFYTSLAFLLYTLVNENYFVPIKITSWFLLLTSILFLLISFFFLGVSWAKFLNVYNYPVSIRNGILSIGLTIFGKYIPGKIWLIVGRASYVNQKSIISTAEINTLSLNFQLLSLLVGISLAAGLLFFLKISLLTIVACIVLIFFWIIYALNYPYRIIQRIGGMPNWLNPLVNGMQAPDSKKLVTILPFFLGEWLFKSLGFWFYVIATSDYVPSIALLFVFPAASVVGIIALFAPGGLGIREGVLANLLMQFNVESSFAITLSTVSRLWFLSGESLFFLLALLIEISRKIKSAV